MARIIFVLALLAPFALESAAACVNTNIPDILNLKTCLGSTSLNVCNAGVPNTVAAIEKVVQCLFSRLSQLNGLGAAAAILDLIGIVISILSGGTVNLSGLNPFCVVSNVPGCIKIFPPIVTEKCGAAIPVSLPPNFNLNTCIANMACAQGAVVTDTLVANIFKTLSCILKILVAYDPGAFLKALACILVNLLFADAAANPIAAPVLLPIASGLKLLFVCP